MWMSMGWDTTSNGAPLKGGAWGRAVHSVPSGGPSWRRQPLPRDTQDMIPLDVFIDCFLPLVLLWRICFLFSILLVKTLPYLKASWLLWYSVPFCFILIYLFCLGRVHGSLEHVALVKLQFVSLWGQVFSFMIRFRMEKCGVKGTFLGKDDTGWPWIVWGRLRNQTVLW